MEKKKVKVVEYNNHPEMEGDELKVVIMNNEKIKPRMKNKIAPRKPKQPRMTINQLALIVNNLAVEMRAGFATLNKEVGEIKETLKRHEEILNKHTEILERHEDILNKHTEILERHEEIFERNNLK